jgi:hypothetical protein
MKTPALLAVALSCSLVSWAADQFDIRPGLWEVTSTVQVSGLPPIPNLDQMTPEQRARIEAAMKNMGGAHTNTAKSCVTKEGIEQAIAKANSRSGDSCSPKITNMTSSKVDLHIECTRQNGESKTNGDMSITRLDPEHFKGSGAMKTSGSGGRTMDMKWSMTGAFVSSDCGNVKPAGQ